MKHFARPRIHRIPGELVMSAKPGQTDQPFSVDVNLYVWYDQPQRTFVAAFARKHFAPAELTRDRLYKYAVIGCLEGQYPTIEKFEQQLAEIVTSALIDPWLMHELEQERLLAEGGTSITHASSRPPRQGLTAVG